MEASLVHRNVLIKYTATNPNISDTTNISGNLVLTDVIQALQSGFISEKHIGNYFRKAISTIISEKQKASCCCCCCLHINRSGLNHTQFVCVFFPSILDIKFVGRTSRGHTGGRSHRIFNPPSFCGACLDFCREKDSAIPFPRRP